jgi:hypothetical protein
MDYGIKPAEGGRGGARISGFRPTQVLRFKLILLPFR